MKLFANNLSPVLRNSLELYTDFLDLGRFSGEAYERRTASYLADKYRDREPEVVIALGPQALRFVLRNLSISPFTAACLLLHLALPARDAEMRPKPITGIISEFDISKTLALARHLQPNARQIVVIAGATEFDREWIDDRSPAARSL